MTRHGLLAFAALAAALGCGAQSSAPTQPDSGSAGAAGAEAGTPLALAAGEAAELGVVDGRASVVLASPKGDEQFVIVLASTLFGDSSASSGYTLELGGTLGGTPARVATACSLNDTRFRSKALPSETPPSGAPLEPGITRTILMPVPGDFESIQVEAVALGEHAVVWADVTPAHPANLESGVAAELLRDFERTILPRQRAIFGMESDIDGDGRISLVFTPLTYRTAIAFFSACDLKTLTQCLSSNRGELLYLTPPSAIDPPYNTLSALQEIVSHECSHLIHYARKVLNNGLSDWQDGAYMAEGVGALAQDVVGPQAGNLYVTQAGLDGIDQFSLADTLLDDTVYDLRRDGVLRGASYLFVRWLYDRAGGDTANADGSITSRGGPALLRDLIDARESIATALPRIVQSSVEDIAVDFYTALALSNRDEAGGAPPANSCFSYLPTSLDPIWQRQRGASVFARFHGMQMSGPAVQPAPSADGKLRAGGVEYFLLDAAGPETTFVLRVDSAAKPRVRVGRLR